MVVMKATECGKIIKYNKGFDFLSQSHILTLAKKSYKKHRKRRSCASALLTYFPFRYQTMCNKMAYQVRTSLVKSLGYFCHSSTGLWSLPSYIHWEQQYTTSLSKSFLLPLQYWMLSPNVMSQLTYCFEGV